MDIYEIFDMYYKAEYAALRKKGRELVYMAFCQSAATDLLRSQGKPEDDDVVNEMIEALYETIQSGNYDLDLGKLLPDYTETEKFNAVIRSYKAKLIVILGELGYGPYGSGDIVDGGEKTSLVRQE